MDKHGNVNATEGVDRCVCGCKYWENDKCIDCNLLIEQAKIQWAGRASRYFMDVQLNIIVTTMVHYRLPWLKDAPITPLEEITAKHRAAGNIL